MRGWLFYYDSLGDRLWLSAIRHRFDSPTKAIGRREKEEEEEEARETISIQNVLKCVRDHHIEIAMKQIVAECRYFLLAKAAAAASSAISMKNCALCVQKRVYQHCNFSRSTFLLHSLLWKSSLFSFISREKKIAFEKQQQLQAWSETKSSHIFYFHFTRPGPRWEWNAWKWHRWGFFVGVDDWRWLLNFEIEISLESVEKRCSGRTRFESFANSLCWPQLSPVHDWWHTSGI